MTQSPDHRSPSAHRPDAAGRRALLIGAAVAAVAGARGAAAQGAATPGWPERPLRLVVPFPGGSTPDLVGRTIGGWMAPRLGQPVVVENRTGAGGNIGTDFVAKATDGHTIGLSINGPITTAKALFPTLPYDPARDLAPIAMAVRGPQVLVVAPKHAGTVDSVGAFLALARTRPGALSFGSVGVGSGGHLAMVEIMDKTGTELTHVAYRGFPQVVVDLIGDRLDATVATIGAVLPQIREGRAKALATTGERRARELPDVPTVAEAGMPDATSYGWSGLFAPSSMPAANRARLEALAVEGFRDPAVRAPLEAAGFEVLGLPSAEFAAFIARETDRWGGLATRLGLRAE